MSLKTNPKVALIGNPNSGKSSLFNQLTGLRQKIGNFPGVTVDKKEGICLVNEFIKARVIDLPGTYSLYPRSSDEQIVTEILLNPTGELYPDLVIITVDATNLRRNLLLFTQVRDLGVPAILALNMIDVAERSRIKLDLQRLEEDLNIPVAAINSRTGKGINRLKELMAGSLPRKQTPFEPSATAAETVRQIKGHTGQDNNYRALLLAHQHESLQHLSKEEKASIREIVAKTGFNSEEEQSEETVRRYQYINEVILNDVEEGLPGERERFSNRLDRILTHKIGGYAIFFLLLFLIFQAIFAWAEYPMHFIDSQIARLAGYLQSILPSGPLTDLLTEGVLAGLGGILIFIPQIAILFAFITILEETGYMARVVYMMDKIMRRFGLNGKSVVPLISGVACAVPAIMATRYIDNRKERLITLFVTPFMSCSARLPVFAVLIGLIVPAQSAYGINLQGIVLMGAYLAGFLAAIGSALLMKYIIKATGKGYFIMELPPYKMPRWKNVGHTIFEKVQIFVVDAGKIILAISIVLWVLASYGPGDSMDQAASIVKKEQAGKTLPEKDLESRIAAKKLELSYAGRFGKFIEPAITPLGYDWKIGIALLTSFAAREVFVGTMATIYSVGTDVEDQERMVTQRIRKEKDPETGGLFFNPARALSLLVFYLFAMQCMSTLAVVYRETRSWKWPVLQFFYMTGVAWLASFLVYQLMK